MSVSYTPRFLGENQATALLKNAGCFVKMTPEGRVTLISTIGKSLSLRQCAALDFLANHHKATVIIKEGPESRALGLTPLLHGETVKPALAPKYDIRQQLINIGVIR